MTRPLRILAMCFACAVLSATPAWVAASDAPNVPQPVLKRPLGAERADLQFPGIGRVVLVFLVTIGIGVGAVFLLKRMPHKAWARGGSQGTIRVLERVSASTTLRVYLVEVERARFMIAEGRNGVDITPLADSSSMNESGKS